MRLPKNKKRLLFCALFLVLLGAAVFAVIKFLEYQRHHLESYVNEFNLPQKKPEIKRFVEKFDGYTVSSAVEGNIDSPVSFDIGGGKVSFTSVGNHILGGLNNSSVSTEGGKITYGNIYNGINLIYTPTKDKILEEYQVRAKRSIDYLAQKIDISGLKYEKKSDGSIIFSNSKTGSFAFAVPKPVMYEAYNTKNRNFGLHYEIFNYKGDTYLVKVIDKEGKDWLAKSHYPVMIDATILLTLFSYTSYPTVDGTWQINAQTVGSGDLEIKPGAGTTLGDVSSDLSNLTLTCKDKKVDLAQEGFVYTASNFSCDGNISITTKVKDPTKQNSLDITYSGYTTNITSIVDTGKPVIISSFLNPPVVKIGDKITVNVEVSDAQAGISSVLADMGGVETISLNKISGTANHGVWQADWIVHGTATKTYQAQITAFNTNGDFTKSSIGFFDPYTCLGGGDHAGADWNPVNDLCASNEIAGNHTNIGTFSVNAGQTVSVKAFDQASSYGIATISASTVSVASTGTLTAAGKGWAGGGIGVSGSGPGGSPATSCTYTAGAGHGGKGGIATSNNNYGAAYGSLTIPGEMGSGAAGFCNGSGGTGGSGGGYISLIATGTITVDGTLSVNGTAAQAPNGGAGAGGGSGGSIYISGATLDGAGLITASGGAAGGGGSIAGGGGGGRIAMYYSVANNYSGSTIVGGGPGGNNNWGNSYNGVNGTAFIENSSTNDLLIPSDNGVWIGSDLSSWSFNNITFNGGVVFQATNAALFTISSSGITTIASGVTISATGSATTNSNGVGVYLNLTGNITVPSGSKITADRGGYLGGAVGVSAAGGGPGGATNTVDAGGAGYGGKGQTTTQSSGGSTYGSLSAPVDLGSGGNGWSGGGPGGNGGGALRLTTTGTLTISGTITSNGGNGAVGTSGGSGGSIYITAGSLAGSGTINANGGNGGSGSPLPGGGGGGRIAIYYTTVNNYSGTITVSPGSNGTGGENGTAFIKGSSTGDMTIPTSNSTWNDSDLSSWVFHNLTINGWVNFKSNNANLLTITATGSSTIGSNVTISATGSATTNSNGAGLYLKLSGNVTIPATSTITANNGGYLGGAAGSNNGSGPGNSTFGNFTGGGGYGGSGGAGASTAGGSTYGSSSAPVDLGSGSAGSTAVGGGAGGNGAGAIRLGASGTLTVNGSITANGSPGSSGTGGGSGGSIYIAAGTLAGNGIINANGGGGGPGGSGTGGGGGGRIAVYYLTNSWAGNSLTAAGAAVGGATGGGSGGTNGTNGTVSLNQMYTCLGGGDHQELDWDPATDCPSGFAGSHTNIGTLSVANGETATVQAFDQSTNYGIATMSAATANIVGTITADGKGWNGGGDISGWIGAGGSHGGIGAVGLFNKTPGPQYGSLSYPGELGQGGQGGQGGSGGTGGGVIQIITSGTFTVNSTGIISANGNNSIGQGGGGSGGSIYISTSLVNNSGTIRANGGTGTSNSGGGGGGRIALLYRNNSSSLGTITTNGGTSGGGPGPGGYGTTYILNLTTADLTIPIGNGTWNGSDLSNWTFHNLIINGNLALQSSNANLLTLTSTGSANIASGITITALGSYTTNSNGVGVYLNLSGEVTIPSSTTITANATGYLGAIAGTGAGPGGGGGGNCGVASGGGYGGKGGGSAGGNTYGSLTAPMDLGSGGGNATCFSNRSPSGGGAIKISTNGTIRINGSITANGGTDTSDRNGGGSGGSIYLIASQLQGTGILRAIGGDGANSAHGGGGGGRISLSCTDGGNWLGNNLASGSATAGGINGSPVAAAGTVYTSNCFPVNSRVGGNLRINGTMRFR